MSFASLSPASLSYVTQPVWSYTLLVVFGFCSLCLCASPGSLPSPDPSLAPYFFYSSLTLPLSLSSHGPVYSAGRAQSGLFQMPLAVFSPYLQGKPSRPHLGAVMSSFSFSRLLGLVVKRLFLLSLSSIFSMLGGFSALTLTEFLTSLMGLVTSPFTFPVPEEQGDRGSRALVVWHWMVFSTFTFGRILPKSGLIPRASPVIC